MPSDFALHSTKISALSHKELARRLGVRDVSLPTYSVTSYGVNTRFPFISLDEVIPRSAIIGSLEGYHLALLSCEDTNDPGSLIAMVCELENFQSNRRLLKKSSISVQPAESTGSVTRESLVTYMVLSRAHIHGLDHTQIRVAKVHIPTGPRPDLSSIVSHTPQGMDGVLPPIPPWNLEILKESGFAVTCSCDPATRNLRLIRLLCDRGGVQLQFAVIEAFIPYVDVWVTSFNRWTNTAGLVRDASATPTFRFQIRDIQQEQSAQVSLPNMSTGEPTTIRMSLCYLISKGSCTFTLEVLRNSLDSVNSLCDTSPPSTILTTVSAQTSVGSGMSSGGCLGKRRTESDELVDLWGTDIVRTFRLLKRRKILQ